MVTILKYLAWHYFKAPRQFLKIWGNFFEFFWCHLFSVKLLLKTILKPWKGTGEKIFVRGFDPKIILQNFAYDMVSRFVGAIVKIIAITVGIALEIVTLVFGIILLAFLFVWPIILIYSIVELNWILFVVLIVVGSGFFYAYRTSHEKPSDQMSLEELFAQKWAHEIWERAGLNIEDIPKETLKHPSDNLLPFLKEKKIKQEDFNIVLLWEISRQKDLFIKKRFWRKENLFSVSGLGKDWAFGYTPLLDDYSERITALENYEDLIGRSSEITKLEDLLSKSKQSNVLIIGEPGVGKMSLVQKFSRLVKYGQSSNVLAYKRVMFLDLNRALAGLTTAGQLEEMLIKIFNQAGKAGNIILVINNFHNLVNASVDVGGLGKKDISQIITPFLETGAFQLVAVTTYRGLHEQIEKQAGLLTFFEKLEIKEPDAETTKKIAIDSVREIESRVPVKISIQAINEIVEKADLYITDVPFPEKAIDLLEESAIYVIRRTDDKIVLPKHVDKVISEKTEIPIGALEESEKEKLKNLEAVFHKRIVNQEHAIISLSSAMRRSRLEISEKKRPVGSFLFLGPTGVGKTETAKTLAEIYFGSEERMNRFDMSEFQGISAVEKMVGSATSGRPGLLTTAVKENPFSLLLLDEIEKADYGILNLFLQILDEGWITDAFGRKINFRNQIIIATTNAGAQHIREQVKAGIGGEEMKKELLNIILEKGLFRPEFVNRFDGTIVFTPLTPAHLLQISDLMLTSLKKRLAVNNMFFEYGKDLIRLIARLGYDPANGARPMRRVIQKKVEDYIARKLLNGDLEKDKPFRVTADEVM